MRATKYSVPPSSSLVMTVLVLRTSPSRKPCTLHSSRSLPEHKAYTPAPTTSKPFTSTRLGEWAHSPLRMDLPPPAVCLHVSGLFAFYQRDTEVFIGPFVSINTLR